MTSCIKYTHSLDQKDVFAQFGHLHKPSIVSMPYTKILTYWFVYVMILAPNSHRGKLNAPVTTTLSQL